MSYAFSAVADWVCRPTVRTLLPLVLLFGVSADAANAGQPSAEKPVDYARQIKPILSNHCYACHGPDDKNQDSDLRLDLRSSAIESAIEPGDASGSELIARMTSDDPDERILTTESPDGTADADEAELTVDGADLGLQHLLVDVDLIVTLLHRLYARNMNTAVRLRNL